MKLIDSKKSNWEKLDNASKIFPAVANIKDTKVYRLTAELYNDVDPEELQKSLDLTLESFPIYRSILKRGFFWYYFESSSIYPQVELESTHPCSELYILGKENLLFRVSYYKKRINLEAFHALSDGVGASWFLETLLYHYLSNVHQDKFAGKIPSLDHGASISQKMDDSFWKNYSAEKKDNKKKKETFKRAYQIKETKTEANTMKVIEGLMPVNEILSLAKTYNSSLTIFLSSLFLYSIYSDMPKNKIRKPVVLSVPINLRGYYSSSTARNFFTTMKISYDFQEHSAEFEDIVKYVKKEFSRQLEEDNVHQQFERFIKLENRLIARIIPRFIKDFFMKIADKLLDQTITASISNVGRLKVAKEFGNYIQHFSSCVSARYPKITFSSHRDKLSITFTSPYYETDIQRVFFQFLSQENVKIELASNI